MLKETVFIEAPLEEAWDRFELEFAKLFKCSPKKMLHREMKAKVKTMNGREIELKQRVIIHDRYKHFAFISENPKENVTTHYEFFQDKDGTFISSYDEKSKGEMVYRLPFVKQKVRKQLKGRLQQIKFMIETEKGA
ncbi:hypothetical protein PT073_07375 [Erysipelothrix rhusiopathiae]|nr:hypothetical protein [Erysipelothrix rhusiopathiae]MDE8126794.1 hypothetical protein [Erysipelothrix rhusiopathiae]MDE8130147.1 hypothetical protein [Erysipelothrix rhusiopathiae]MDE8151642.1 hypothetical protein [Erysipelothrix rhusiopathiae]MDE8154982.1 hypothetical protein [Erysipelothrix rhusiopathiae]